MPTLKQHSSSTRTAAATPDPPAQARRSTRRKHRLTEYIQAHTGESIEVVLTPHVQTACVLPADEDSLIDADSTDFDQRAAKQLVAAVDGDYLVLIGTHAANLDSLPIDDQLTADRAQQFGLALHELGHIRYTAIGEAADRITNTVDDDYEDFVHGLFNYAEDAAIEHQLRDAQSQLAADRLELVNRSLTQNADVLGPRQRVSLTFRDAIEAYLYDNGIYDSGKTDILLDPDDPQVTFVSSDDAQAFAQIEGGLDQLLANVLSEPDPVARVTAVLNCWLSDIKPFLDPTDAESSPDPLGSEGISGGADGDGDTTGPDDATSSDTSSSSLPSNSEPDAGDDELIGTPSDGSAGEVSDDSSASDDDGANSDGGTDTSSTDTDQPADRDDPAAEDRNQLSSDDADTGASELQPFDPENVSLEPTQDAHSADVLAYPNVGASDDADELGPSTPNTDDASTTSVAPPSAPSSTSEEGGDGQDNPASSDASGQESSQDGGGETATPEEAGKPSSDNGDDVGDTSRSEDVTNESGTADSAPDVSHGEHPTDDDAASTPGDQISTDVDNGASSGQTALQDFLGTHEPTSSTDNVDTTTDPTTTDTGVDALDTPSDAGNDTTTIGDETPTDANNENREGSNGDVRPTKSAADEERQVGEGADEAADRFDETGANQSVSAESEANTGEEPTSAPEPAHDQGIERDDALTVDRDAAQEEADAATPDMDALQRHLEETAEALDTDNDGGSGAGKDSLDELSIMPDIGEQAPPARWQAAAAASDAVAGTLEMALTESRRDNIRSGVTSGSFDRRRAGALARGDVNAFSVRQRGDEKQYDLVLVLDRSSSMSGIISTAEDALGRFALACEDLGINVAIIDFIHGDARLIKPFSVGTQHVQAGLMSEQTGGGTPLTDALGLARSLLEQRRDAPLILIITDGKPGSPDDYQSELKACYAPVCGLTLALDTPQGNIPSRAEDVDQYYDRHLYVHDANRLDDRLDQFAVMFDGL